MSHHQARNGNTTFQVVGRPKLDHGCHRLKMAKQVLNKLQIIFPNAGSACPKGTKVTVY